MAVNRKALAGAIYRAFTAESSWRRLGQSISGFTGSWKGILAGAKSSNCSHPCLMDSRSLIHTGSPKEYENRMTFGRGISEQDGFERGSPEQTENSMAFGRGSLQRDEFRRGSLEQSENRMTFVKGILEKDGFGREYYRGSQVARHTLEENLDVVHIKLIKNNTFVTITDSNGNKKVGASSGCLEEMKGGPKLSRYAAEATAEHVGRLARSLGLKSVVMRVNGFTHFKKKKQAILSWREGYTHGKGDKNPIAYIEDTTRRAHNGCRLPKKRRV